MPTHPIHWAAERGDLAEVQRLITEDPALMELRDHYNRTPLLIAARYGHTEIVEGLLGQGADREAQAIDARDALYIASEQGHTAIVPILLDRGFAINQRADNGWTPLLIAAARGHVGVVELLLSRKEIELDWRSDGGFTAIYWASYYNHPEIIGLLLQAGADPTIAAEDGDTPLDEARDRGHEECIQLLEVSK